MIAAYSPQARWHSERSGLGPHLFGSARARRGHGQHRAPGGSDLADRAHVLARNPGWLPRHHLRTPGRPRHYCPRTRRGGALCGVRGIIGEIGKSARPPLWKRRAEESADPDTSGPTLPSALGNPAPNAGFPHSHSDGGGCPQHCAGEQKPKPDRSLAKKAGQLDKLRTPVWVTITGHSWKCAKMREERGD